MKLADMLVTEFDRETAVTRMLIERAPQARAAWTPHPRSWTLGELCLHIAQLPLWAATVVQDTTFDPNPPGGVPRPRPRVESQAATLRVFDEHVARARPALAAASDPELLALWTLRDCGRIVFTMPRIAALRAFAFNHLVHHRGQLTVYLRLCDVTLPPIYGPTADTVPPPATAAAEDAGASGPEADVPGPDGGQNDDAGD